MTTTQIGRMPPQDIAAEQAVLGAMLINPVSVNQVVDKLKSEDFYRMAHRKIYGAILQLFNSSEPVDALTLGQQLKQSGDLEQVGGRVYLTDLAMSIATTANVEHYAQIVKDKSILRELVSATSVISNRCFDDGDTASIVEEAERAVFEIGQTGRTGKLTHIREMMPAAFDRIEQMYQHRGECFGVTSGFVDLDGYTGGFQNGTLVVVAARPAMGKTAFALNLAEHQARAKASPVAIFSLEMSKEQLVQRLLASVAGIDSTRLRDGFMTPEEWLRLSNALAVCQEAPIYIDDTPALTVLDIRAKARRLKAEVPELALVIVDYIQFVHGGKRNESRVQEVSDITRGLKTLARELNVPVIALSQLSRAVESRQCKRPLLSDLRESGSIEQDSDIVMFLYRDEYYNHETDRRGEAEVIIAKHRAGPVGTVELLYQAGQTRFLNKAR